MFFSDFVRRLTWLAPRECLYGRRHLGRVLISAAERAGPGRIWPCGVSREPTRPERGLCGRHLSRSRHLLRCGRPDAGRGARLSWRSGAPPSGRIPGEPRLLHAPLGHPLTPQLASCHRVPARKTPPSRGSTGWPAPAPASAPAPLLERTGRPLAGAGGSRRRRGPGRRNVPTCRRLSVSASAEGIAGLLDCHRPWVVATGGAGRRGENSTCQIKARKRKSPAARV